MLGIFPLRNNNNNSLVCLRLIEKGEILLGLNLLFLRKYGKMF